MADMPLGIVGKALAIIGACIVGALVGVGVGVAISFLRGPDDDRVPSAEAGAPDAAE